MAGLARASARAWGGRLEYIEATSCPRGPILQCQRRDLDDRLYPIAGIEPDSVN